MKDISIRSLHNSAEMHAVEAVQRQVWPGDNTSIVPSHLLLTAAHNGGLVLGAYAAEVLVGFVFGFVGTRPASGDAGPGPRLKHCSHMLAILPAYRNQHIGMRLKWAQRQHVLHQGIELITWTYDPLEARNAHLNIARLGTVCHSYLQNLYGAMTDALNMGLPSDRFQVDWWIASPRVARRRQQPPQPPAATVILPHLLNPSQSGHPWPHPATVTLSPTSSQVLVEIPPDFQNLKRTDASLALAWRLHTRELFTQLFAQGYTADSFIRATMEGRQRAFYGLRRSPQPA